MVAAIAFAAVKLKKPLKGFVQWQSVIAFIALGAFVVNTMLTGPLYNTLSVVLSEAGELSAESIAESRRVVEEVTNEGIILTKNTDGYLPIAPQNVNVFGWASTNPIYGGTGSGTVGPSTAVGILRRTTTARLNTALTGLATSIPTPCTRPIATVTPTLNTDRHTLN